MQAAVEGALSTLSNLGEDSPEFRRAAGEAGAVEILVACLLNARNGEDNSLLCRFPFYSSLKRFMPTTGIARLEREPALQQFSSSALNQMNMQ
jgi:hypothetical protein